MRMTASRSIRRLPRTDCSASMLCGGSRSTTVSMGNVPSQTTGRRGRLSGFATSVHQTAREQSVNTLLHFVVLVCSRGSLDFRCRRRRAFNLLALNDDGDLWSQPAHQVDMHGVLAHAAQGFVELHPPPVDCLSHLTSETLGDVAGGDRPVEPALLAGAGNERQPLTVDSISQILELVLLASDLAILDGFVMHRVLEFTFRRQNGQPLRDQVVASVAIGYRLDRSSLTYLRDIFAEHDS